MASARIHHPRAQLYTCTFIRLFIASAQNVFALHPVDWRIQKTRTCRPQVHLHIHKAKCWAHLIVTRRLMICYFRVAFAQLNVAWHIPKSITYCLCPLWWCSSAVLVSAEDGWSGSIFRPAKTFRWRGIGIRMRLTRNFDWEWNVFERTRIFHRPWTCSMQSFLNSDSKIHRQRHSINYKQFQAQHRIKAIGMNGLKVRPKDSSRIRRIFPNKLLAPQSFVCDAFIVAFHWNLCMNMSPRVWNDFLPFNLRIAKTVPHWRIVSSVLSAVRSHNNDNMSTWRT